MDERRTDERAQEGKTMSTLLKLNDWSIRRKLTFVTMLTSGAALLVACAAFVAYDYVTLRRLLVTDIAAHADVVGANCTAAIAFGDAEDATRTLASFAAEPKVMAARVCDADGRELAFYARPGYTRPAAPSAPIPPGTHAFREDKLTAARHIRLDGNVVGTIYVCSDLSALHARVRSYLFVFGGVVALASLTAWPLASRLQRLISSPVQHLAETARRVSAERDYSGRAVKHGRDELGTLIDCFNEMLDQIQQRDAQLEGHRAHLEQQVGLRTEELRGANDELRGARDRAEAANRAKSAFLANMSHEIRTPMTAIVGYADMMLEPEQTLSDRQDCLQVIRRNARHLLALIGDILDLSKIEADKMTVERITCDPAQLAVDVVSLIRPKAVEKGLTFDLTFGGEIPRQVMSDPLRLKQVLVNLCGNAVKFTERGGVRMRVSCARTPGGPDRLQFDVADTGIGLTAAQIGRLFQPFSQADESMTRRFGGTGLGLVISKRLAELMGGDIRVQSVAGCGSTFTLVIDPGSLDGVEMSCGLEESMVAVVAPQPAGPRMRLSGRILLAEDGPDNQRLISTHLRRAGADVVVVENGRLALERVASEGGRFDLIFMDMQMPELDGYGATSELRRRGWTGPVVALTAHAMSGDREKCLRAGCTDYLTKPVDRDVLVRTAASYMAPAAAPPRRARWRCPPSPRPPPTPRRCQRPRRRETPFAARTPRTRTCATCWRTTSRGCPRRWHG
jgi:two-component system, sensor histidine kinase